MAETTTSGQLIGPITIETLANGGNAIAREQGRVIFIPGAFPGDIVLCRVLRQKKSYADAEIVELLQPSPLRRIPPCPVADVCGGCQWQQLRYAEQLTWKQRLFVETLTRQAGVDPALILPIIPAPEEWGYRSRVQVKCFHSAKGFSAGFFRPKSHYVVEIDQCPLMADRLNRLLAWLRERISSSSYASQIPQLDLAVGSDSALRAVVHYLGHDLAGLKSLLLPLSEQHDFALAVQTGRKNSMVEIRGTGDLMISIDDPAIHLSHASGGFAQVNLSQNRTLVKAVMAAADLKGTEQVLDLYCGMGNFTLPLARRAGAVTGVEDYVPSIRMAKRNAATNGINNVDFHAMPAEQALQDFTPEFDLLILDPPRAGAFAVAKQLLRRPIKRIVYVSCDPQTLARDLKPLLSSGYQLLSSQAIDMFPQTYHIESLTLLEYRGR